MGAVGAIHQGREMRRARVDQNHGEVVEALRAAGAVVTSTASIGNGFPDLIAAKGERVWMIEVKGPKGKLTPDQVKFIEGWPGVVHIIRSKDEALTLVGEA